MIDRTLFIFKDTKLMSYDKFWKKQFLNEKNFKIIYSLYFFIFVIFSKKNSINWKFATLSIKTKFMIFYELEHELSAYARKTILKHINYFQ
jgi:hypothetical protein